MGEDRMVRAAVVRVLHADTDAMGIVYHGAFVPWFEHARVEFMRRLGLVYRDLETAGFGLPVVELCVRYLAPGRHDDRVELWCDGAVEGRARVRFTYRAVRTGEGPEPDPRPRILARGWTVHACMRTADGRPTRLPEALVAALGGRAKSVTSGTRS